MNKNDFNEFLKQLELTSLQVSGNTTGNGYITTVANGFRYENGEKTDIIDTQNYTVVFPDNGFVKVLIKVKGDKPIATNDQIKQKGKKINVTFKNLTGRIYYNYSENNYVLTGSADGIEVVQ